MYRYQIMDGSNWMWGAGMMLFWLVALIVVGIVAARLLARSHQQLPGSRPEALDIVRERYAKGEITHEEFVRLKKDLQ